MEDDAARFQRWCPACKRGPWARGLSPYSKRELAASFASQHLACFRKANPDRNPSRCSLCGLLLLNEDRCPVHVYEERVEWTPELGAIYAEIVDAFAAGSSVVVRGAAGVFDQAYGYARLWGNLQRPPWVRELAE